MEDQGQVERYSVLNKTMDHLDKLAEYSEKTAERIDNKLYAVCRSEVPSEEKQLNKVDEKEVYPQLFDDMRTRLESIESNLERINSTINRCEL